MPRVQIVTDSGARFSNPRLVRHLPVSILPNIITIDGTDYREDLDFTLETAFELISQLDTPPTLTPPSEEDYTDLFMRLAPQRDAIISVHPSRHLNESWVNARMAAQTVGGDCHIAIVDSGSLCAGQGMLVRVAARAAEELDEVEAIIQRVRQAVDRIYSMYCVRDVRFLRANDIMSASHAILCEHLGIKPFVSLEGGKIIVIEKTRHAGEIIERLVEFLVEFNDLEDTLILQHQMPISEQTRVMHELLALEFPGQHFPFAMYSASMACYLGASASGVAVLEREDEDDFVF